jgi:hypothetical protein
MNLRGVVSKVLNETMRCQNHPRTGSRHSDCGCRCVQHKLYPASGRIRAGLSGTNRWPGSPRIRRANPLPTASGNRDHAFNKLAVSGADTGLRQRGARVADSTTTDCGGDAAASAAAGRIRAGRSRAGLLLGAGILVLGRAGLDLGRGPVDDPALAPRHLGARRLGQPPGTMGLSRRALAVADPMEN